MESLMGMILANMVTIEDDNGNRKKVTRKEAKELGAL